MSVDEDPLWIDIRSRSLSESTLPDGRRLLAYCYDCRVSFRMNRTACPQHITAEEMDQFTDGEPTPIERPNVTVNFNDIDDGEDE